MTPKLVDADQKKREIIEAVILVLSEKGIKDIRIIDVAERLGIGKSTIYEYFSNKEELLKQTFEFFLQEFYIPERNEEFTFMEELKYILDIYTKHTEEERKLLSVMMDVFFASIKGDFFQLDLVYQDYIDYMVDKIKKDQAVGLIREDINPEAVVSWIGGTLDGLGILILVRSKFPTEQIYASFLEAVEKYLTE